MGLVGVDRRSAHLTDQDLLARAEAFDQDGRQIAWTPESVGTRMIEAASVFSRTPMRIGPSGASGFWPETYLIAQELVDEATQARVMAYVKFDGNWYRYIDDMTKRRISENVQAKWNRPAPPEREQYSRAEEALRWPALYLADRPLLADALTLWALCIGTGASLRATLRRRIQDAVNARSADKNYVQQNIARYRRAASAIICERLHAAGIALREADRDISLDADE